LASREPRCGGVAADRNVNESAIRPQADTGDMRIDASEAIKQVDDLLAKAEPRINMSSGGTYWFQGTTAERAQMRTRMVATIERLAPRGSRYVLDATASKLLAGNPGAAVPVLAGVLRALRDDYEAGYLQSIEELIHADLFADFLEMAEELHGKGYKDPAAVITGSVLEEHLRKLASAHAVPIASSDGKPRKADSINADLARAGVYNKLVQKQVVAWLDLRNKAAHGDYEEYEATHVDALIRDVRSFMASRPA
jgi:hypothetical protein